MELSPARQMLTEISEWETAARANPVLYQIIAALCMKSKSRTVTAADMNRARNYTTKVHMEEDGSARVTVERKDEQ